jgi:ABC-type antimicrobial peptide transport system permease subunit
MTGFGLAIGLVLSVIAGKSLESLLFGVKGSDPLVLAFTVGMLAVVALFAGGLPAHKAASVDPVIALRYE